MDVLQKHPWLAVAAVIAVVGYVIVRRLSGEPLNARDLFAPPLILTGIGVYQVLDNDGLSAIDLGWIAGGVIVGIACGAWRGSTIRLFVKNDVLWQRYTARTFIVWIVSLAGSGGYALITALAGLDPHARPVPLSIGIGLLGEMAIVGARALASGHRFAPDDRDAAKHVHDHMRQTLRGRAERSDLEQPGLRDTFSSLAGRLRHDDPPR